MAYADKYVHRAEDVPTEPHYAIIRGTSVTVPAHGVWAPGHGYPEHTEQYVEYQVFFDREKFLVELQRQMASDAAVRGIYVTETFHRKVVVSAESSGAKR